MTVQAVAAGILIVGGSVLDVPVAIVLGTILLLLEIVHWVWVRFGLDGVSYIRRLATDRTSFGHDIPLNVEVWNRKRLPLAWLSADDATSPHVTVRERDLVVDDAGEPVLRNAWTLAPYERVTRRLRVAADRRGVFTIGPARLTVGDLFARPATGRDEPATDTFIVRPRTVPVAGFDRPDRWGGETRARLGPAEDPARFAGVRPYAYGDPRRRIHHRTSARLGRPMTKRFEPSRDRDVLIALDLQTEHGPSWEIAVDEDAVESLIVVAASLARALVAERAAFGIAAAGYTGAETRIAHLPVSAGPGQLERVLDLLARLSSHASAPFERLLDHVRRVSRPGTTVVVVTARDPRPFFTRLRGLERAGLAVVLLGCGSDAAHHAVQARAAGFAARRASLDAPWRTADAVSVVA